MDNRRDRIHPVGKANTLAILDVGRKAEGSKVTIASEQGVREAKDWVDNVEK